MANASKGNMNETRKQEIVTNINTDSFGRVWGKIKDTNIWVWLTYAVDSNGTWLDDNGNYHFSAKGEV